MGWLPLYLTDKDVEFLNDWLNQEEEIAFLVSNGPGRWIAKKHHNIHADIEQQKKEGHLNGCYLEYALWHVPAGPLPLFGTGSKGKPRFKKEDWDEDTIPDPWKGWNELRQGADSSMPYFGAGSPRIFRLTIFLRETGEIPISGFEWTGNHYKIIGDGADKVTEKFWGKLRRLAKKVGKHIPRQNNPDYKNEIYIFPDALNEIQLGRLCSLN